jgi:acyl-CoA thioesterase-1
MVLLLLAVNMAGVTLVQTVAAAPPAGPVRIVALGDSLTAGLGLPASEALPAVLERSLRAAGRDVAIQNAGVSGDTTAGGLARLDWAVPDDTEAVIVALGANDMLGGLAPERARSNLEAIVRRLRARGIEVLVAGMQASRSLGSEYAAAFDPIFPEIAAANGALLYPFLLEGVALDPALNQPDGIHPTAEGVRRMAARMLPVVEALVAIVEKKRASR